MQEIVLRDFTRCFRGGKITGVVVISRPMSGGGEAVDFTNFLCSLYTATCIYQFKMVCHPM